MCRWISIFAAAVTLHVALAGCAPTDNDISGHADSDSTGDSMAGDSGPGGPGSGDAPFGDTLSVGDGAGDPTTSPGDGIPPVTYQVLVNDTLSVAGANSGRTIAAYASGNWTTE